MWHLTRTGPLIQFIDEQQWLIFSKELPAMSAASSKVNGSRGGAQLLQAIDSAAGGTFSLSSSKAQRGVILQFQDYVPGDGWEGHAVVAYNVDYSDKSRDSGYVDVYDPNIPYNHYLDESHLGDAHLEAVTNSRMRIYSSGVWSYRGANMNWSGPGRALAILPIGPSWPP